LEVSEDFWLFNYRGFYNLHLIIGSSLYFPPRYNEFYDEKISVERSKRSVPRYSGKSVL